MIIDITLMPIIDHLGHFFPREGSHTSSVRVYFGAPVPGEDPEVMKFFIMLQSFSL
jgi:hypothetical protein